MVRDEIMGLDQVLERVLGSAAGKDVADATRLPVLKHEVKQIFDNWAKDGYELDKDDEDGPDNVKINEIDLRQLVMRELYKPFQSIYVPGQKNPTLDEELRKKGIQLEIKGLEDFEKLILASIEVFQDKGISDQEIERVTNKAIQQGLTRRFFSK